ncbi:MAG: AI-2E family transporter [Pseudomonadota bacterium]
MYNHKHLYFWGAVFLSFVAFVAIFNAILLPFILGLILGYLLDPLADRLEKINCPRGVASLVVLFFFFTTLFVLMGLLWPVLKDQFTQMAELFPQYFHQAQLWAGSFAEQHLRTYGGQDILSSTALEEKYGDEILAWMAETAKNLWSGGTAIFNVLSLLVITPIVAFYLLRDWDRMVTKIDSFLPVADRPLIHRIMRDIDETLAGFLRGQGLVCLLLGMFYALGLTIVGLNFGVVIGLFIGLISFVPYIGAIFGGMLCVGIAALQFSALEPVLLVGLVFAIGQFLEGNILAPKLVGDNVNLHPVWIIFALLAGGSLLGFMGVMIAVPVAAVLGVVARYLVHYYLHADVYTEKKKSGRGKKTAAAKPKPRKKTK